MSRRKKTTEVKAADEASTATALVEQDHIEIIPESPGFADRVGPTERPGSPDPFKIAGDYLVGIHLFESRRDQQMALKFDEKPDQSVIDDLKAAGFRWKPADQVWAHPISQGSAMATRIDAERLYQKVREKIRHDKGMDADRDVPF